MPRRSPLPRSRENLMDLLGHVDRFLEHYAGLTGDLASLNERGSQLDPATPGDADPQFAVFWRRVAERQDRGYPPSHAFAPYFDFPFDPEDVDGRKRLMAFWRDLQDRGGKAVDETIYRLALDLRRAVAEQIETTLAPDWLEGTRSELNDAFGKATSYPDYFERAAERGEVELAKGPGKLLRVRASDPARHEVAWRNLSKRRSL